MKPVAAQCIDLLVGSPSKERWRAATVLGCAISLAGCVANLRACGPFPPEQILTSRQVILRTPVGDFAQEVMALTAEDGAPTLPAGLTRVPLQRPRDDGYDTENTGVGPSKRELAELREALDHDGVPAERRETVMNAYQIFRTALDKTAASAVKHSDNDADAGVRFDERAQAMRLTKIAPATRPDLPAPLSEGLPGEWADYLEGAVCFWGNDLDGARGAWVRLLARPQSERLYCSTKAAYMLARVSEEPGEKPETTASRYQRVRELRAAGCRDLFNLASDSFGWEARLAFTRKEYSTALRLYYLQAVSGGEDDLGRIGGSLRAVVKEAMGKDKADPEAMAVAARDPFLRRVITLYLACDRSFSEDTGHLVNAGPTEPPAPDTANEAPSVAEIERRWLASLTQSGVDTVREAAAIAWMAYEAADYAPTAAWLEKAPAEDGLALWLRAKMALRDGKTEAAAALFSRAVRAYPAEIKEVSNDLDNTIQLAFDGRAFRTSQFHADLGIISLSRSDYAQALTALLRSGFWRDAAYVAERVMTADELLAYVRTNFPQAPPAREPAKADGAVPPDPSPTPLPLEAIQDQLATERSTNPAAFSMRYLLARRLARAARYMTAREYYPEVLWPKFDEYVAARQVGDAKKQPAAKRADALWRAAKIERGLGMELFGSEDDPDWFVVEGEYDEGLHYSQARRELPQPAATPAVKDAEGAPTPEPSPPYVPPVGKDEKRRLAKDQVQPEKRFHYRYIAADLAWRAAALMPDQNEMTAEVLAAGGRWLESRDETKAADKFYLAILRRCAHTAIGRAAQKTGNLPAVSADTP